MQKINFSDEATKTIQSIIAPIKTQYIEYSTNNANKNWKKKYQIIKDPSWPECNEFDEFENLPTLIQEECIFQHHFSPEIWKKAIIADADKIFNQENFFNLNLYYQSSLDAFLPMIQGKKIIDFGCCFGRWSVFAVKNNCHDIIAVDVRQENLTLTEIVKTTLEIPDEKLKITYGDIHDYQNNQRLCLDRETVFLLGIMYHVHDHFSILESVLSPTVQNLIIETAEDTATMDSDQPLIWWTSEPSFQLVAGWHHDQNNLIVGYPNVAWFDLALKNLGFERTKTARTKRYQSDQEREEFTQHRSLHFYQKI